MKKFRKEFEDHLDGKPCPFEKAAEWQNWLWLSCTSLVVVVGR